MHNYKNSKIYKIICNTTGLVYIGSTTQSLKARLSGHTTILSNCTSKVIIDNNNYEILLIENYPCNSKKELEEREGSYQKTIDCVNKRIEGSSNKQSKEEIKKRKKQYREEKIEKYRIISKQSYENSKKLLYENKYNNFYPINIKDEEDLIQFISSNKKNIIDIFKKNNNKIIITL